MNTKGSGLGGILWTLRRIRKLFLCTKRVVRSVLTWLTPTDKSLGILSYCGECFREIRELRQRQVLRIYIFAWICVSLC